MSDIAQLMRAANPVPDAAAALPDDEFGALLILARTRSGTVDVQEIVKPVEPEHRNRRGWFVAAAAFAAVIIVAGVTLLLSGQADNPPATTPPTTQAITPTTEAAPPTTVAAEELSTTTEAPVVEAEPEPEMTDALLALVESYEAAFNSGDEEAFRSLFVDGVRRVVPTNPGLTTFLDKIVAEMINLDRQESTLAIEECTAMQDGVSCRFTFSGPVELALFGGPVTNTMRLHLDDGGRIVEEDLRPFAAVNGPWRKVLDWVETNYPEVRAQMIEPGFRDILAYEDSALWLEYAPLWAEAGRP